MDTTPTITNNEAAMLAGLSRDLTPAAVGLALNLSESAVYAALRSLRERFNVRTLHGLVLAAERAELLAQPEVKA
jgi:DNA-binding CsgD family transcriptional regulator